MQSLAIAIPVYNNSSLLRECLHSIQIQSSKEFDVHIYDDDSTENYLSILKSFSDFPIIYTRNKNNLGALANMQFAYNDLKGKYKFVMIMHEDDLLHQQFIETVMNAISLNKSTAFAITNFTFFDNSEELTGITKTNFSINNGFLINKKELALRFLQLKSLAFGSVVYNTQVYKTMELNIEQYEEFADRPFLLNGLNNLSQIALINEPIYFYRSHGLTDNRWKRLLPEHVFNALKLYKEILLKSGFLTTKVFKKYAMAFVFEAYKNLLLTGRNYFFLSYLWSAKLQGFFSFKYALLKNSTINKAGARLKKIFN